jgi:hypothetical protein
VCIARSHLGLPDAELGQEIAAGQRPPGARISPSSPEPPPTPSLPESQSIQPSTPGWKGLQGDDLRSFRTPRSGCRDPVSLKGIEPLFT